MVGEVGKVMIVVDVPDKDAVALIKAFCRGVEDAIVALKARRASMEG